MSESCSHTTEEGNASCALPVAGQASACGCAPETKQETPALLLPSTHERRSFSGLTRFQRGPLRNAIRDHVSLWHKIRGGLMFGVACIASPCCTPLIVPLVIALLAGTPVAAWLTAHLGWVYGGLTLLSALSLGLGFHWMKNKDKIASAFASRRELPQPTLPEMDIQPITKR